MQNLCLSPEMQLDLLVPELSIFLLPSFWPRPVLQKHFLPPFLAYKSQFPLGFLSMLLPLWAVLWNISWWVFQFYVANLLQHACFSDPFDSFCHHLPHHLLHSVDGPFLSPSFWEQSYILVPSPGILGSTLNYVSQISILGNSRSTHPSGSGPMLPLPHPAGTCWQGPTTPLGTAPPFLQQV